MTNKERIELVNKIEAAGKYFVLRPFVYRDGDNYFVHILTKTSPHTGVEGYGLNKEAAFEFALKKAKAEGLDLGVDIFV